MIDSRRRTTLAAAAGAVLSTGLAGLPRPLRAQDAARPLTLVVPFAVGGATDVTARRFAETLTQTLGSQVIVENKPSAGGFVAATQVANAPKDGTVLLFAGTNSIGLNPLIYRKLPYKTTDLVGLSTVSRQAFTVNANLNVPTRTIADFVAYANAKPDGISFGTVGVGTTSHILAEWIGQSLGIRFRTVPYKGTSQSTLDLLAGLIDVQIDGMSTGVAMHKAGKTHLLAAMGQERAILPDGVPNFAQAGFPDLVAYAEFGLFAPTGTPDATMARLHKAVSEAVRTPSFVTYLAGNGEIAIASASPADYDKRVASEQARWSPIVKRLNLQLD